MKRRHVGTAGRVYSCACILLVASCLGWPVQSARATCVAPMNMAALADGAGQVIVGRITSVRSYWTSNPRTIESAITLDQVEYLKGFPGALANNTFALRVPGGSVDGTTLQLSGTPTLRMGQTWLLFLQSTYKTYPVVGFSQGAFQLIGRVGGTRIVQTSGGSAVLGLDATGFVRSAGSVDLSMNRLRAMHRVRIVNVKPALTSQPMDWPSFRTLIEPILSRSTDHHLTKPAGQPDPIIFKPTSIQKGLADSITGTVTGRTSTLPPSANAEKTIVNQTGQRISTGRLVVPKRDTPARSKRKAAK